MSTGVAELNDAFLRSLTVVVSAVANELPLNELLNVGVCCRELSLLDDELAPIFMGGEVASIAFEVAAAADDDD